MTLKCLRRFLVQNLTNTVVAVFDPIHFPQLLLLFFFPFTFHLHSDKIATADFLNKKMFLDNISVCAESSCLFYCFNFMSVAMELCRFACLTCQHRELLRPRFQGSRRSRLCSGEMHVHISPSRSEGTVSGFLPMPSSEPRGTSPCSSSEGWKVASL